MTFNPKDLSSFSTQPGVYLMYDIDKCVLYVGKAKNLKSRLKQYFQKGGDGRQMIPYLTAQVETIQTIVVDSETEALILENSLIKKHRPKYNVLYKDDKSHICLHVNTDHKWPTLKVLRSRDPFGNNPSTSKTSSTKRSSKKGLRLGPYPNAFAARGLADQVYRLFRLRQCSDRELSMRKRPCILYGMHRCSAPCVGMISEKDYADDVKKALEFLKGKRSSVARHLKCEIQKASESLEFERAAYLLKQLEELKVSPEKSRVASITDIDRDAIGFYRSREKAVLVKMAFRSGILLNMHEYLLDPCFASPSEAAEAFITQHYMSSFVPDEILAPCLESKPKTIEAFLNREKGVHVKIEVPSRGEKKKLIALAEKNAHALFEQKERLETSIDEALIELGEKLFLTNPPQVIECIDQSHLSGSEMVSGVVRYVKGKKEKKGYRSYKVRLAKKSDDYGALKEALTRHLKKLTVDTFPDLIVIDGGRGHLNIALEVLSDLNLSTLNVIGCAKEDSRHDKGMSKEALFHPEHKEPIHLDERSNALLLLQRIRDEAHRYAITFQKKRRSKALIKSALDEVPGIGTKKKAALIKHFGSVAEIKKASQSALLDVPGISNSDVEKLLEYL